MKVKVKVREDVTCGDRRGKERTGESCVYMTNKALDVKKITIIKRGKRTNPANKTPFFVFFFNPTFPPDG